MSQVFIGGLSDATVENDIYEVAALPHPATHAPRPPYGEHDGRPPMADLPPVAPHRTGIGPKSHPLRGTHAAKAVQRLLSDFF